jgi:hypothetical protein
MAIIRSSFPLASLQLVSNSIIDFLSIFHAGIIMASASAIVLPWVIRNYVTFGVLRVTTADTANLVYWVGAGA